jgi:integrase
MAVRGAAPSRLPANTASIPKPRRHGCAGPCSLSRRRTHTLVETSSPHRWTSSSVLFHQHTGWDLHQLRHSAATHLGDKGVPLRLIMAKTRHRNPRTVMRYVEPGAEAVAEITQLLEPPRRRG